MYKTLHCRCVLISFPERCQESEMFLELVGLGLPRCGLP